MSWIPLSNRGVVRVTGKDRKSFLQGLITNDIFRLSPSQALYSAFLTPQGRYLHDFFLIEQDENLYIDIHKNDISSFIKRLGAYKLRSDVTFQEEENFNCWACIDQTIPFPEEAGVCLIQKDTAIFRDPRLPALGLRMISSSLPSEVVHQDYTCHRISLGVPEAPGDLIQDKSLLLENGLDELQAIDWEKGCYLGQEMNARTRYRGIIRKRLFPVNISGCDLAWRSPVFYEGDEVGEMRSHHKDKGLALLKLEAIASFNQKGGTFISLNTSIIPSIPDWMRLPDKF